MINLNIGLNTTIEITSSEEHSANKVGSGGLDVYSSPSMIALMEKAAMLAVEGHLPKGFSTVGTEINVRHIAATPINMKVRANAELISVDNKKLTFKVEAFDDVEKIGEGTHTRYIIDIERFRTKTYSKI